MKKDTFQYWILTVCLSDTYAAPMMAAFLRQKLQERGVTGVTVESAGLDRKGRPADPNAIAEMKERGLDISNHCSRRIDHVETYEFDRILCADRTALAGARLHLRFLAPKLEVVDVGPEGITAPYNQRHGGHTACAQQIEAAMERVADAIAKHLNLSLSG